MCQEANVVAIAKIAKGGQSGVFWYTRNREVKKATISGGLQLDVAMKEVLNGTKIQKLDDSFSDREKNIITINQQNNFMYFSNPEQFQHPDYYLNPNKKVAFSDNANTITF